MVLTELEVKRYCGKNDDSYYSFISEVCSKKFVYLQTGKVAPEIETGKIISMKFIF